MNHSTEFKSLNCVTKETFCTMWRATTVMNSQRSKFFNIPVIAAKIYDNNQLQKALLDNNFLRAFESHSQRSTRTDSLQASIISRVATGSL